MQSKVIIFSAPSGSGKSTIIRQLMARGLNLHFSVSATCRPPRPGEKNGVDYFFLEPDDFKRRIEKGDFLEYEEVYPGRMYGTLREQVDRQLQAGENVVCDVDVLGGCNIKKNYGQRALSVFIQPPSIETLRERLLARGTETADAVEGRLARAKFELSFAPKFDVVVINDELETAVAEVERLVRSFLEA